MMPPQRNGQRPTKPAMRRKRNQTTKASSISSTNRAEGKTTRPKTNKLMTFDPLWTHFWQCHWFCHPQVKSEHEFNKYSGSYRKTTNSRIQFACIISSLSEPSATTLAAALDDSTLDLVPRPSWVQACQPL